MLELKKRNINVSQIVNNYLKTYVGSASDSHKESLAELESEITQLKGVVNEKEKVLESEKKRLGAIENGRKFIKL